LGRVERQFGVKGLLSTNTASRWAGWFTKEVQGPGAIKACAIDAGIGGEVLRRLGSVVVRCPGARSFRAEIGAIDAASGWSLERPSAGLHKSPNITTPGFHGPDGPLDGVNKKLWDSFSAEDRNMITMVAGAEYRPRWQNSMPNNARALQQ